LPSRRESYVVEHDDAASACEAVFDVLGGAVVAARVDAYSDYADQMPADIRAAELWLRDRGLRGAAADPAAGIMVERADETGWAIVRAYALWSSRVVLCDGVGVSIAVLEDAGNAITVELPDGLAAVLAARLAPQHGLALLADSDDRIPTA
jgi:hypothetical protein